MSNNKHHLSPLYTRAESEAIMNTIKRNMMDVVDMLKKDDFRIDAGDTSNCATSYDISAVAETLSGVVLQIIVSKWCGRWVATPIEFIKSNDGKYTYVALSNFGTPQISSLSDKREAIEDCIRRFNYDVEPCENLSSSRLERIAKVITKDGEEISFI